MPVNWREIKDEIDNAPHGMKTAVKEQISERLGLSLDQIHSAIRDTFGPAKTIKKRKFKKKEDREAYERNRRIAYLAAEQKQKMKAAGEGEREMATWRILKLFREWEIEGVEECNESTINRIMAEEMGFREKTPRTRHEPAYALQEVQVDFSFSKYFTVTHYDKDQGDYILQASRKVLRYKEGDKRMRPMLGVIMDSYSRLRYHKAIITSGESGSNTTAFMISFFNRDEDELVFRHVPWMFKMDNGPLAKSQEGQSFFKSIRREVQTSTPYEKTGIGKAERGWQLIWQWEMEIASRVGDRGMITLNDYNSALLAECVRQQYENHPFYSDRTRIDMYQQSILAQDPRPEVVGNDLRDSVYTVLERTVGQDQIIKIANKPFQVPVYAGDHHTTGRRIRVLIHRDGRMKGELIDRNADLFDIDEFIPTQTGTFNTHAKTFPQQLDKHIKNGEAITDQLRKLATTQNSTLNTQNLTGPKRLMPASDELTVDSPFSPGGESAEGGRGVVQAETCRNKFEALSIVAEILKREGHEMSEEVRIYFETYAIDNALNKTAIMNEAHRLIQILNEQTGT